MSPQPLHHVFFRSLFGTLLSLGIFALVASSCSLITDSDVAASGIGAACSSDDDCQGSSCDQGACVAPCSADGDCPFPSKCWGNRCVFGTVIGQPCQSSAQCQGAACSDGICVTSCSDGTGVTECPAGSECFESTCQKRMKVAAVWVGVVGTGEGWTLAHHEGMLEAQQKLGYIDFDFEQELLGASVATNIDRFVAEGAEVIISNSFDHRIEVDAKAAQYPDVKFLICSGKAKEPNIGSYFGNVEQAWYVAGQVAALKTKTKRIGFIGSYITPEVVRNLNAFALGARSKDSQIVVEIRWLGFWYDPQFQNPQFQYQPLHMGDRSEVLNLTAEEYLTAKLIDSGADVIGHQCDNQLPTRYVAQHTDAGTIVDSNGTPKAVFTIANDNRFGWQDSAGNAYSNAVGAVYWNWGPTYARLLNDIHRHKWVPSDVVDPLVNTADSIVGFQLSTSETDVTDIVLSSLLNTAEDRGPQAIFTGPINTTGQRSHLAAGTSITNEEYRSMCWFVEGVVERSNPNDFSSQDQPAKVPTATHVGQLGSRTIPQGGERQPTKAPEVMVSFSQDDPASMWNCELNQ